MSTYYNSRRSPVCSTRGLVAASQPLAVAAGIEVLNQGGSAADAAVAAGAALAVCEPTSTGLGGDCFALFFDAKSGRVTAINGSGSAPRNLTLEKVRQAGFTQTLPPLHPYTITVPGACAAWCDLIEKHGNISLDKVLAPAVRLAEDGFPVAPLTAQLWERNFREQLVGSPGSRALSIAGRAPRPGEIFRNHDLANVLIEIAENGKKAFYCGQIASRIVQAVVEAGGVMTLSDLAEHTSTWEDPISTLYHGVRIWECPPNGQGLTALLALNLLEGFDLSDMPSLSARRLHLLIESLRLAFADARWFVSDPASNPIPIAELLSKEYARLRRQLIDPKRAVVDQTRGSPFSSSDTVYLCTVDQQGNACSFINSNYLGFGTGIVPPGCGFPLQNRGLGFSLDPEHPNALAPSKRPYHTIIPAMATLPQQVTPGNEQAREQLFACFGVMGGYMQPQGHVQVLTALIDDNLDVQSALDRPRICLLDGIPSGMVALEEGIPFSEMARLAKMGHVIKPVSEDRGNIFGRGQIIIRDPSNGVFWGGSDPRADGCAMTC